MPNLVANRLAKTSRFIDFLDAHLPADADPETLAVATDAEWARIAELAGEAIPSVATRSAIVVGLRERRIADPFAGLPGIDE